MPVMRDRELRRLLLAHLADRHIGDLSTRIVEELAVQRGQRRVDVAVINGILAGFEIKSDADDLSRLGQQAIAYGAVFDELTLVCGQRHLEPATRLLPPWWGLVTVGGHVAGGLTTLRPPAINPARTGYAIAELLWRDELIAMLTAALARDVSKLRRRELLEAARDVPVELVAHAARVALQERPNWRVDRPLA